MYRITFSVHLCKCQMEKAHKWLSDPHQHLKQRFPGKAGSCGSINCLPESHNGHSSQWWCNSEASWKTKEIKLQPALDND